MPTLLTDPIDLKLDEHTHDLAIEDGDFVFIYGVDGVAQLIKIAVLMIAGEWYLDLDEGVKWKEREGVPASRAILGQKFDERKAISEIRDAILKMTNDDGSKLIQSITAILVDFDRQTRDLSIRYEVITVFGDTIADTLSPSGVV